MWFAKYTCHVKYWYFINFKKGDLTPVTFGMGVWMNWVDFKLFTWEIEYAGWDCWKNNYVYGIIFIFLIQKFMVWSFKVDDLKMYKRCDDTQMSFGC